MRTCERCRSVMLQEPFFDDEGSGDSWFCLACGNRLETYTVLYSGAMTAAQLAELMQPARPGRPRGRQVMREGAK